MDKYLQRKTALTNRRNIGAKVRKQASEMICHRLVLQPEILSHRVIFSYFATAEEVDLSSFHQYATGHGCTLAFPVTGEGGQMEAYIPEDDCHWQYDRYGIQIPDIHFARRASPEEISLVLTPLVAFDEAARRLGHGGGYYDRYFARYPRSYRLGIAFEAQKLPEISCGALDVPLHGVLTEKNFYLCK